MTKRRGMENEFWKEDGGETAAGESHMGARSGGGDGGGSWGHFITKTCAFLVFISWSRQQLARVKGFRQHHPEPSLSGLWLEFLPGCPELPGHAASRLWLHPPAFPAVPLVVSGRDQGQRPFPQSPGVATQSGLGILEHQGPGMCHYEWQTEIVLLGHCQTGARELPTSHLPCCHEALTQDPAAEGKEPSSFF